MTWGEFLYEVRLVMEKGWLLSHCKDLGFWILEGRLDKRMAVTLDLGKRPRETETWIPILTLSFKKWALLSQTPKKQDSLLPQQSLPTTLSQGALSLVKLHAPASSNTFYSNTNKHCTYTEHLQNALYIHPFIYSYNLPIQKTVSLFYKGGK